MKPLTIAYITARKNNCVEWMFDSLARQIKPGDEIQVIVVDHNNITPLEYYEANGINVRFVAPKPTVWSGPHRLTREDWWSTANARNTALCLCRTPWIAFLDDRCVLMDGWLQAVRNAIDGNYIVCGSYQKRTGMTVENGVIKNAGIITGEDSRVDYMEKFRPTEAATMDCPGEWMYGCTFAMPLEWALLVNGVDETCDGLSMEDVIFGLMCQNNGFPMKFDKAMKMIEDRTPSELGRPMTRKDKGASPNDKSHMLLNMLKRMQQAKHPIYLRQIREAVLNGGEWPKPWGPTSCFFDNQLLSDM